jgi:hypothetical protein
MWHDVEQSTGRAEDLDAFDNERDGWQDDLVGDHVDEMARAIDRMFSVCVTASFWFIVATVAWEVYRVVIHD